MGQSDSGKTRRLMDPAERRRQVLAAARDVFVAQGYGGASMRAVAQAAGVNEALLYRIAPSKEQLFAEAVAEPLQAAVNHTIELSLAPSATTPDDGDVRERAVVFVRDLLEAMRQMGPQLNAVLGSDHEFGSAFYAEHVEPAMVAIANVVRSNLALWTHRDFDAEVIVRVVYGVCWFFALDERYGTTPPRDPDQLAPELLGLLFDGMRAREGEGW